MNSNKLNGKSVLVYLPFIIFFIIIFLWHFMIPSVNDDMSFGRMFYEQNLLSSLSFHYENWTSRILIEFFLIPLAGLPRIIWNFFDSIVFVLIAVLITKMMWYKEKNEKSLVYSFISCILVSIYIYTISPALHSAGYIATTLNYTWPLFFGLLHFYLVKEYIFTKKNLGPLKKIVIYVLMLFALLFAINQELLLFVVSGVYF
ncbi:MAG: DUF6056 family protein, partial [Methanobacterium sp.]|nr:DUF6056 family protein [Methanobacterium sp.]